VFKKVYLICKWVFILINIKEIHWAFIRLQIFKNTYIYVLLKNRWGKSELFFTLKNADILILKNLLWNSGKVIPNCQLSTSKRKEFLKQNRLIVIITIITPFLKFSKVHILNVIQLFWWIINSIINKCLITNNLDFLIQIIFLMKFFITSACT